MQEHAKKIRPPLPPEHDFFYEYAYKDNRQGKGLASFFANKMEAWMHKMVAKSKFDKNKVLEIGAGTLNQLEYELPANPEYDIVEPFEKLYKDSPYLGNISNIYSDISQVPKGNKYDRIISIATYEHILELPQILETARALLKPGGGHYVAIPNEGHLLWKLGWKLTTGLAFRLKFGLDYSVIMGHEHVNTADEIESCLKQHYKIVDYRVFGITRKICFYRYYHCERK